LKTKPGVENHKFFVIIIKTKVLLSRANVTFGDIVNAV